MELKIVMTGASNEWHGCGYVVYKQEAFSYYLLKGSLNFKNLLQKEGSYFKGLSPVSFTHYLYLSLCENESVSHSGMPNSLGPRGLGPTRLLCPWDSPQRYCSRLPCLLQGIVPTQGCDPGLPHCRQILYHLSYPGSPNQSTYFLCLVVKMHIYTISSSVQKYFHQAG